MESVEDPQEQAQRHVTEGLQRIATQEALIQELERDGHDEMLPAARALLAEMQKLQRLGSEHLQRERAEAGKGDKPS